MEPHRVVGGFMPILGLSVNYVSNSIKVTWVSSDLHIPRFQESGAIELARDP